MCVVWKQTENEEAGCFTWRNGGEQEGLMKLVGTFLARGQKPRIWLSARNCNAFFSVRCLTSIAAVSQSSKLSDHLQPILSSVLQC